jgi:hypothetical protein
VGTGDAVNVGVTVNVGATVDVIGIVVGSTVGVVTVAIVEAISVGGRGVGFPTRAGARMDIPTQANIRNEPPIVKI